jgi:hypothetical protein
MKLLGFVQSTHNDFILIKTLVRIGSSLFRNLSHLYILWFGFYFKDIIVYRLLRHNSSIYTVKSGIFNLDHEMDTFHFI